MILSIRNIFILLAISGLLASCSHTLKEYQYTADFRPDTFPNKIYVGDEIYPLNSSQNFTDSGQYFVAIRKKNGENLEGKLMNIGERHVTISTGYYLSKKTINAPVKEKLKRIPKNDILIMKVW